MPVATLNNSEALSSLAYVKLYVGLMKTMHHYTVSRTIQDEDVDDSNDIRCISEQVVDILTVCKG